MPVEIFLLARPFTRLPSPDHLLGELAREIAAAVRFVWPEILVGISRCMVGSLSFATAMRRARS